MKELELIHLTSGVNEKGHGFITIVATSSEKEIMVGQFSPQDSRQLGEQCFEVAEAAETDAIIFRLLKSKFDLEDHLIGAFITDIRNAREGTDE